MFHSLRFLQEDLLLEITTSGKDAFLLEIFIKIQ